MAPSAHREREVFATPTSGATNSRCAVDVLGPSPSLALQLAGHVRLFSTEPWLVDAVA